MQISAKYLKRSWSKPMRGFGTVTVCVDQGEKYDGVSERLLYYQAAGLLTIGFETQGGDCPAIYATVSLTDAGRKYAVDGSRVRVWNLTMGAVTGVQLHEQFNVGEADYLLQVADVTPFGSNLVTAPLPAKASFELFDDGWRIKPEDLEWAPIRVRDMPTTPALEEARRAVAAALATEESRPGDAEGEGPSGTYVSSSGDYVKLDANGTFVLSFRGREMRGTFTIQGQDVSLTLSSDPRPARARLTSDGLTFPSGETYVKR